MRSLISALVTLMFVLALAASAHGGEKRIPWLTFNEVSLNGTRHVLSRHDIFPETSSLSPRHDAFAYVDYTCDGCPRSKRLMVADVRGAGERSLFDSNYGIDEVAWAPSGNAIAFVSDGIWLIAPDGTNLRRVGESGAFLSWSPDGSQIAYMVLRNYDWVIRILSLETQTARDLAYGQNVRWSPDGRQVAYETTGGRACTLQVRVIDVSTAVSRAIACGSVGAWSPNGRWISLVRYVDYTSVLWIVKSRGGKPRRIASAAYGGATSAVWAPDSRSIAFQQGIHYCGSALSVVAVARGSRPRRLAAQPRLLSPLGWSTSGRKVLYEGDRCSDQ